MPFNPEFRSKKAASQTRNSHGQFASNSKVKSSVSSSGSGAVIGNFLKTGKIKNDDESLMTLSLKDPFAKFVKILQDIKNHQDTKVNMRFTIPLIVLPTVILIAAYVMFGRGSANICSNSYSTVSGTIKNLKVIKKEDGNFFTNLVSFIPYFQPKKLETVQTILIDESSFPVTVSNLTGLSLGNFENQKVYLSGSYSSCKKEIELIDLQNISQY